MLLHSGRTYSLDNLNMEFKLDLILKELQYLKLRVEELENKKKRTQEMTLEIEERRRPIDVGTEKMT